MGRSPANFGKIIEFAVFLQGGVSLVVSVAAIYIYTERDREEEREADYILICILIYNYIYAVPGAS